MDSEFPDQLRDTCLALISLYLEKKRRCSEYDLLSDIVSQLSYSWSSDALLNMFQKHFLIRHCLYLLQETWCSEKRYQLVLSPVSVELHPWGYSDNELPGEFSGDLAGFYLDTSHFYTTDADEVAELLASFWRRYNACDKSAFELLGLAEDAAPKEIKARYRALLMDAHPDRGGDSEEFDKIRQAFLSLKSAGKC